jgi:esterase/lipase superfamily enzyme
MVPGFRHCRVVCLAALVMGGMVAPRLAVAGSVAAEGVSPLPAVVESDDEAECSLHSSSADASGRDVWIASTRRLPGTCRGPAPADFAVQRLTGHGPRRCWEPADLGSLLSAPDRPLVIFIHGNRYDSADAQAQGLRLADRLSACRPAGPTPRVVVFSWPSQKQGILLKDGRRKYERAYADGHYLAWLLGQVQPEQPVGIVGYSFGALVAAEALEDLAAGDLPSSPGLRWADRPGRTHLVLVAPAIRSDAVAPRGPFRSMLSGLDRFTLLINSRDEALRFFPLLEPQVRADALGFVGLPRRWLPAELEYRATDAAAIVGKMHTMQRYLDSGSLSSRIAGGLLDGLAGP